MKEDQKKKLIRIALIAILVCILAYAWKPETFQLQSLPLGSTLYFDLCQLEDRSAIGGTRLGTLDQTGLGHGPEGVYDIGTYQVGYRFLFKGHLVDSSGKGISNAWVNIYWFYPPSDQSPTACGKALTDSNGWYGFPSAEYPNGNWGGTITVDPSWNGKAVIIYAVASDLRSTHFWKLSVGTSTVTITSTTTTATATTTTPNPLEQFLEALRRFWNWLRSLF